jgi:hypothetical protein
MLSRYNIIVVTYYLACSIIIYSIWLNKSNNVFESGAVSLSTVLVASEYYEIPMFIAGFLGYAYWFPYPSLIFLLHHLNIIVLFIWLLKIGKVKVNLKFLALLSLGLIFNTFLLVPEDNLFRLWTARISGLTFLFGGVYSNSMVGEKS